jgi:hypothetical protein
MFQSNSRLGQDCTEWRLSDKRALVTRLLWRDVASRAIWQIALQNCLIGEDHLFPTVDIAVQHAEATARTD